MVKRVGKALATGIACRPFREHLEDIKSPERKASSWSSVEVRFLRVMEQFDDSVVRGEATDGERQNGKGDYLNDLLATILENSTEIFLDKRTGVPGLIFPNHSLDVPYPSQGLIVDVLLEAKMLGTPRHRGNKTTAKVYGRPGSSDMLKRCKEAGFKTIDLKAAYGMLQAAEGQHQQEGVSGDLTSWLRTARPSSYLFAAVRVVSEQDANAVIAVANAMTQVVDGVGLFMFGAKGFSDDNLYPASYQAYNVPSYMQMQRVLQRVSQDLRAAKRRGGEAGLGSDTVLPSLAAMLAVEDAEDDD